MDCYGEVGGRSGENCKHSRKAQLQSRVSVRPHTNGVARRVPTELPSAIGEKAKRSLACCRSVE